MLRNPKPYTPLLVKGAKYPDQEFHLTYIPGRGFVEPITNQDAAPIIGDVLEWKYSSKES